MSNKIWEGGPAFPSPGTFDGMSLRDWFAGQAISGAIGEFRVARTAVEYAYLVADTMLEAREEAKP
jgi:hypothetical protein